MKIEIDRRLYDTIALLAKDEGVGIEELIRRAVEREANYHAVFHKVKKEVIATALGGRLVWPELQRFLDYIVTLRKDERLLLLGILMRIMAVDMPGEVEEMKRIVIHNLNEGKKEAERFEEEEEIWR